MPEAKVKPWRTVYMDTYTKKKVPKPPTYKRGNTYSKKYRIYRNYADTSRPRTADFIDTTRPYDGCPMLFASDIDGYADDIPLDLTVTGSQMPLTTRGVVTPHYMDTVADSFGADEVKQFTEAEIEAIPRAQTPLLNTTDTKDYHWSVWPQQETVPRPQSAFAKYPDEQFQPISRPLTPVHISTDKQPDYHWSVWPQPQDNKPDSRPHTALGIHNEVYTGENIGVTQPINFDGSQEINENLSTTYVPEIQSWVTAGNDYEKDIATKMSSMYLSQTPRAPPEYMRPKREASFSYGYGNRITPMAAAPGHYKQSWFPYTHNSLPEDMIVKGMAKRLENADPVPGGFYRSNTDIRPMNSRYIRYPRSEDYIHQHSMFMSTSPLVRGHFIIHPDWVSERMSKKKINTIYGRKKSGLRYGTN